MKRYFLDSDQDGHWYIVPVDRAEDWHNWSNLDGEDERAWTAPDFVMGVGGCQSLVTFENPYIDD